jgi:hypothetical protein
MFSARQQFAAAVLFLLPGMLLAQFRPESPLTRPVNGGYPPAVSPVRQWPPDVSPSYRSVERPGFSLEEWANQMGTSVRDPYKRIMDRREEARDFYLSRSSLLLRPAWIADPPIRPVPPRPPEPSEEQKTELRSLWRLPSYHLPDPPPADPDRR